MKVVITGAAGFVAPYVARALRASVPGVVIVGATRSGEAAAEFDDAIAFDLNDPRSIEAAIEHARPTHVLHLAGVAAPQQASADPQTAWRVNTLGTLALGRTLFETVPDAIFLNAGSGAAYGDSAKRFRSLDEEVAFAPADEYGATKAAADLGLGVFARRGLKVVRLRPFNQTGPGQTVEYAIPAFAAQIAAIERGEQEPVVKVGNLDAERDFCDVADIAKAYALAMIASSEDRIPPGRAYNLCSGRGVVMRAALDMLLSMSEVRIETQLDPARMRPSDIPRMVGDPARARAELGWQAMTPLDETLRAVLEAFRDKSLSSNRP
ncbi:NAD-dependent epimerase/dehydratase [Rhodomicrobium vannielii ATCC 17100]|uniref:NAD-dependent epimerase/dehydratase n=1 Tax=Rhodomicrobium vannielii (strain ATCC 17100 / DSM 162 / LMG 4299 / NCIMB 10020 / ATH 3.1.1) TaxID=648757 RepID=E3I5F5_RHOVT|nr:GDP-mannose 4,6-dehydratase [Rhodomicrobium vannielii]ADP71676.1 NAD-dependent epimerase/dehydratase [Rhodomicrobium vannielii ATCC 17100]